MLNGPDDVCEPDLAHADTEERNRTDPFGVVGDVLHTTYKGRSIRKCQIARLGTCESSHREHWSLPAARQRVGPLRPEGQAGRRLVARVVIGHLLLSTVP